MSRIVLLMMVALLVSSFGCAAERRGGPAAPQGSYSLRVDLALAGELANDRGRGAVRADLTGRLTFAADDGGTQVRSQVLAVRDMYVDPRLGHRRQEPDARLLRAVLLATDDYRHADAPREIALVPATAPDRPKTAFFHELFTRDLEPPRSLPAPAERDARTIRRAVIAGVEAEIEETLTLVRVHDDGGRQVAEYAHRSAIRGTAPSGERLEVDEHGVVVADVASGLPLRHACRRTERLVADGVGVVDNTLAIDASYTAVAAE